MEIEKAISFIKEKDNFLLSTHVNPDGDGVGSILGLLGMLKSLGKTYTIVLEDPPMEKLSFLERIGEIEVYKDSMKEMPLFSNAIIIDVPNEDRVGKPLKLLEGDAKVLNIDHHISNEFYGEVNLVRPEAAASAQIITDIYRKMNFTLDEESAKSLYTGISFDTGGFRFNNTTSAVFEAAGVLVRSGAQPDVIAEKLFHTNSLEKLDSLGRVLSSIELHFDGKVASAYLNHEYLSSELGKKADTEGFANYPLSIEGVEVSMLIKELKKGISRINLRSRNSFDVNELASRFGGGGHPRASGATIEGDLEDVKRRLLDEIGEMLRGNPLESGGTANKAAEM